MGLIGVAASAPELIPKHLLQTLIGIGVALFVARIRTSWFLKAAPFLWVVSLVLLVLTLIMGEGGNDSAVKRWLDFGFIRFQPSEIAKLALIIQLGSAFARKGVGSKLWQSTAMIMVTTVLVLLEPDLGTTMLIFISGLVMMFAAGVRFTNISAILIGTVLVTLPFAGYYLETHPYILQRALGFQKGLQGNDTRQAEGYQVHAAKRAMAQGGLWGLGVDARKPRVPADHTDMIISSIAFANGQLGVLMVVFAYVLVVYSGLQVTQYLSSGGPITPELHGASVMAAGATFMLAGQAFINLGVSAGVFPVTGVPLPMVSFGGSSQVAMGVAFGLMQAALRGVRTASNAAALNKDSLPKDPQATRPASLPSSETTT